MVALQIIILSAVTLIASIVSLCLAIYFTAKLFGCNDQRFLPALTATGISLGIAGLTVLSIIGIANVSASLIVPAILIGVIVVIVGYVWAIKGAYEVSWAKAAMMVIVATIIGWILNYILSLLLSLLGFSLIASQANAALPSSLSVKQVSDSKNTLAKLTSEEFSKSIQRGEDGCVAWDKTICKNYSYENGKFTLWLQYPDEILIEPIFGILYTGSDWQKPCEKIGKTIGGGNQEKENYRLLPNETLVVTISCNQPFNPGNWSKVLFGVTFINERTSEKDVLGAVAGYSIT